MQILKLCANHCAQLSFTEQFWLCSLLSPNLQTIIIAQMLSTGGEGKLPDYLRFLSSLLPDEEDNNNNNYNNIHICIAPYGRNFRGAKWNKFLQDACASCHPSSSVKKMKKSQTTNPNQEKWPTGLFIQERGMLTPTNHGHTDKTVVIYNIVQLN